MSRQEITRVANNTLVIALLPCWCSNTGWSPSALSDSVVCPYVPKHLCPYCERSSLLAQCCTFLACRTNRANRPLLRVWANQRRVLGNEAGRAAARKMQPNKCLGEGAQQATNSQFGAGVKLLELGICTISAQIDLKPTHMDSSQKSPKSQPGLKTPHDN